MKKSLFILVPILSMLLAGCNSTAGSLSSQSEPIHQHTFESNWTSNDTVHYHKATCEHTDLTKDLGEHVDNNKDGKCDICNYTLPVIHEHTFDTKWSFDQDNHYHQATCEHTDLTKDLAPHTYNKDNICTVCGYIKHNCALTGNLAAIEPSEFVSSLLPETMADSKEMVDFLIQTFVAATFGEEGELTLFRQSFEYESVGFDGKSITLSGAITIPYFDGKYAFNIIDFDSHPTFTDKLEAVSYGPDIYSVLSIVGALVIEFDLIGYGSTYYLPADYHCHHSMVTNTIDGILAASYLLEENFGISISKHPQMLTGYSQGGYDALALLRYLETEASEEVKKIIKPVATCCGSGAYDLKLMIDESLANPDFIYPEYILMGIITAKYYHPEIFGNHEIEEFLTNYGKRFITPILNKDDDAIQALKLEVDAQGNPLYTSPSDFFSEDFLTQDENGELKQIVKKYCEGENLLDGKWMPQGKLYLFYSEDDEIVTAECSHKAEELFANLPNVEIMPGEGEDHRTFAITYYLSLIGVIGEILEPEA